MVGLVGLASEALVGLVKWSSSLLSKFCERSVALVALVGVTGVALVALVALVGVVSTTVVGVASTTLVDMVDFVAFGGIATEILVDLNN